MPHAESSNLTLNYKMNNNHNWKNCSYRRYLGTSIGRGGHLFSVFIDQGAVKRINVVKVKI